MKDGRQYLTRYADAVIARRWSVLGVLLVVVAAAVTGFAKLEYDTTYRIWFEEDSAHLADYDELLARFGSDDSALIVLAADERVVDNDGLAAIQSLTKTLWAVDGVKRVDSLTNFSVARASRVQHESYAFAATDTYVAAAGDHHEIFVFGHDGAMHSILGHSGTVEHLYASPEGRVLYSAALDRTVRAWDAATGEPLWVIRDLVDTVSALRLSVDGTTLFVGSLGSFSAYDATSGRPAFSVAVSGFVTAIHPVDEGIVVVSNGVSVVGRDGRLHLDLVHSQPLLASAILGDILYVGDGRGTLLAVDWRAGNGFVPVHHADASVLSLASADDSVVAGLGDGSVCRIFADGRIERTDVHEDWVTDVLVDGDRIITASRDKNVVVRSPLDLHVLTAHRASVRRLAVHGDRLYTVGDDGDVFAFDRRDYEMVARYRRSARDAAPRDLALDGPERASVAITNDFRQAVDVRVAGVIRGRIEAGETLSLPAVPIPTERPCPDGVCEVGQYCDFESDTPMCTAVASIAFVTPNGIELEKNEIFLRPGHVTEATLPADDAFSVTEAVAPAVSALARVDALIAAYPEAAPTIERVLPGRHGDVFVSPDLAEALTEAFAEDGVQGAVTEVVSTLAQVEPSAFALPMQPLRLEELTHHLTRAPDAAAIGAVLNPALDTTLFVVAVHQPSDDGALERSKRVTRELRTIIADASAKTGFGIHLTGGIVQETTMEEYAQREIDRLLPLFFAVLALMLIVVYRRPAGLLVPLGLVVASIGFSMGLAGHLGASLNNMVVVGPQVVLAACIGDAVHLFNSYTDRIRLGGSVREATHRAVTENFAPCFWTSASTSLGFFSLCTSHVVPVATFGWIAGLGVIVAFILSFTFMPAVLVMLPRPKPDTTRRRFFKIDELADRLMIRIAEGVNRQTAPILVVSVAVMIVAAFGLSMLRFNASELGSFREDAPIRIATNLLEDRHLSGSYGLHLMVDTNEERGVRRVDKLRQIAKLESYLAKTPELVTVSSVTDIQRQMNRVMHQDDPEYFRLPATDAEASGHYDAYTFSLKSGMSLTNRVSADEGSTLIDLRFESQDSTWFLAWGDRLQTWAKSNVPDLGLTITGKGWLVTNTVTEISLGFVKNVGSAVLLISLLVLFAAGSIRIGLPACVANVAPVMATLGVISLMGDSMDISAIVACCVAMGIVVDDTLHFMARYASLVRSGKSHDDAVIATFRHSGKAMVFTTGILVVGFLIFGLADYTVTAKFGVMAASMLVAGLICDLTMLPAALRIAGGETPERVPAQAPARAGSGVF